MEEKDFFIKVNKMEKELVDLTNFVNSNLDYNIYNEKNIKIITNFFITKIISLEESISRTEEIIILLSDKILMIEGQLDSLQKEK